MAILKKIKENLRALSSIEVVAKIYQEIANLRMNQIRRRVLDNREFIERLSQVYVLARNAHVINPLRHREKKKQTTSKSKKKRVAVFLSGNERFYGNLILNIWQQLMSYLAKKEADLAVVGRMGKYLAERSGFGHKMFYFELNDDDPEKEKIKGIFDFAEDYKEVIIFHGRFQTILSQKVVQSNISGGLAQEKESTEFKSYLFEPSPQAVLEFFESELMSAFLNQAVLEHRLSRYATRMIAMHHAGENARERKSKLEMERQKLGRQLFNKEQIELFSGFKLWR